MQDAPDLFEQRRARLLVLLARDATVLLSKATDIRYFFGFSEFLEPTEREALAVFNARQATLFMHALTSKPTLRNVSIMTDVSISSVMSQLKKITAVKQVFFDVNSLVAHEYIALSKWPDIQLTALDRRAIWQLRMEKDATEQVNLTKAAEISKKSFSQLRSELKAGMSEIAVADRLDNLMKENGSRQPAFPTIVAFGEHTALPHHQPSSTLLAAEMPILIDFGATWEGYRADMTRTVWFGEHPDETFIKVEKVVIEAYKAAVQRLTPVQPKLTAADLDLAARGVIENAGYGARFIHTTGHGVGLDIHEPPSLNSQNSTPLQPGMAITIEPGIYLPGKFGYRHEDTVLILKHSPKVITEK